jgi:hypothetical protein
MLPTFVRWFTKKTAETDEEIIQHYTGDDYVQVIWENEYNLVVISVDSGIEVIHCLKKADITKSQTVEL